MKIKKTVAKAAVKAEPKKAAKAAPAKAPAKKAAVKKAVAFTLRVYSTSLRLEPGKYEYKFVVDGTWCADPECLDCVPNDQGTLNSVIVVK